MCAIACDVFYITWACDRACVYACVSACDRMCVRAWLFYPFWLWKLCMMKLFWKVLNFSSSLKCMFFVYLCFQGRGCHRVLVGPKRSICTNLSGLEVETIFLDLKDALSCFPFWHDLHRSCDFQEILGRPLTKSLSKSFEIYFKLKWPSFLCQISLSSSMETKHVTFYLLKYSRLTS